MVGCRFEGVLGADYVQDGKRGEIQWRSWFKSIWTKINNDSGHLRSKKTRRLEEFMDSGKTFTRGTINVEISLFQSLSTPHDSSPKMQKVICNCKTMP